MKGKKQQIYHITARHHLIYPIIEKNEEFQNEMVENIMYKKINE